MRLARVVPAVHAGRRTVAIRVPAHPVARALAAALGSPITATSANRSGERPAQLAPSSSCRGSMTIACWSSTAATRPVARRRPSSTRAIARRVLVRDGAISWDRVLNSLQNDETARRRSERSAASNARRSSAW